MPSSRPSPYGALALTSRSRERHSSGTEVPVGEAGSRKSAFACLPRSAPCRREFLTTETLRLCPILGQQCARCLDRLHDFGLRCSEMLQLSIQSFQSAGHTKCFLHQSPRQSGTWLEAEGLVKRTRELGRFQAPEV